MTAGLVCALCASLGLQSCIGSFTLSNKLLAWNKTIDNKFVNELVFIAFWLVPVYEVSFMADILVLNSIEFWSGTSPVAKGKSIIDGKDGKYLVDCDGKGYTIKSLNDGSEVRLNFHEDEQEWTVVGESGAEYKLLTYVDDTHVKVPAADGSEMLLDLSSASVYAYQALLLR